MQNNKLIRCFGLMLFIALFVVFSYFVMNNVFVDSDNVEGTLWAKASIDSGSVLSHTFRYPYAIPFGSNLIFIPFVKLFGVSLLANRTGMLFFFVIATTVFFYFSSAFDAGRGNVFFIVSIMIMAFATRLGFNLLGHILYYLLDYVCLVGMIGSLVWINRSSRKRIHYVLLALFALWGAGNGPISVILSVIPLLMALLGSGYYKRSRTAVWIVIGSLFFGLVLYKLVMKGVQETDYVDKTGSFNFRSVSEWLESMSLLPKMWIELFITSDPIKVSLFSLKGIHTVLELCYALLITAIPLLYIVNYKKLTEEERWVFHGTVVVWMICLAQFIFFRGASSRLLFNCVLMNSLLTAIWFPRLRFEWNNWRGIIACVITEAMLVFTCLVMVMDNTGPVHNVLAEELQSRGLTHGYASYWDSNSVTVFSNEKIRSCTISVNDGKTVPYIYNIDGNWYQRQKGDFYLALKKDEYESISRNRFFQDNAKDYFSVDDYRVYVFDEKYWDAIQSNTQYNYGFSDDQWSNQCDTIDHVRYIHDGGISYGPFLTAGKNDVCYVRITGEALSHADILAYCEHGEILYEPKYELLSDNEATFEFPVTEDTTNLEVVIKNPDKDEYSNDIVVSTVDISINVPIG